MEYYFPHETIIASPAFIAGSVPVRHIGLPNDRHQLQLNLGVVRGPILEIDVAPNHVRAGLMLLRMTALALGDSAGRGRSHDFRIEPVEQIIDIGLHDVVRARRLDPVCFEGTVGMSAASVPVRLVPGASDDGTQDQALHLVSPAKQEACATDEDAHAAPGAVAAHDQWVATTARSLALDIPAAGPASGFDAAMEEARQSVTRELPNVAARFHRAGRRRRFPDVEVNLVFAVTPPGEVGAPAPRQRARASKSHTSTSAPETRTGTAPTMRHASGIVTSWSKDGMVTCQLYFNRPLLGEIVTVPEACITDFVLEDPETHWSLGGYTHRVRADYGR